MTMRANLLLVAFLLFASSTTLSAQCDGPCTSFRWEGGASWNPDGTIDDAPNAGPINGIIRCGSSAETQSQLQATTTYDPADFIVDIAGFACVEPSTGNVVFPDNPTPGQPVVWMNFDVRPLAGTFQIQINDNSGDEVAWALFYSNVRTSGVTENPATGEMLSGDFSDLQLTACGVESANTWNTIPVPNFVEVTNYYIVIWDQQADGNISINNFKARFGCGESTVDYCNVDLEGVDVYCNPDGTYSVDVNIIGLNGQYRAVDSNALNSPSESICLTNLVDDTPVTTATFTLTYPADQMYSITVAEVTPSTLEGCAEPINTDSCMITGISGMPPVCCSLEVECPTEGGTYECVTELPEATTADVTVISSCGEAVVTFVESSDGGSGCVEDPRIITRTYTITDDYNEASCQVQFTVVDTTAPQALFDPSDVTIECDEEEPVVVPSFTDNCDDEVSITMASSITAQDCGYTIHRSWTATDDCGNSTTVDQVITVVDTTAPVITEAPEDVEIDCGDELPMPSSISAIDNCSDVSIEFEQLFDDSECPHRYIRTWTAFDECGNSTSHTQVIYLTDNQAPVIDAIDVQISVSCDELSDLTIPASDNCTSVSITFDDLQMSGGCLGVLVRTWYATDECGNESSVLQYITVTDFIAPTIIGAPADIEISCDSEWPEVPTVEAEDNCSSEVQIQFEEVVTGEGCDMPYEIMRTWVATDYCGNESTVTQIISVIPVEQLFSPVCASDFDGNGVIAAGDLLLFLADYGCEEGCGCDLNGDGRVDTQDMLTFLSAYNQTCE